jgi:hypothetical protein
MRSIEDIIDCQGGNEMRSIEDLIDCQEGKEEERRLYESLVNSAESSYQQRELVEEDQKCILIIGGIQIVLQKLVQVLHMRRWCNMNPRKRPWGQMILKLTMYVMQVQQRKDS